MRVTIDVDEALLRRAGQLTGIKDGPLLIQQGLRMLVARESARRLADLGGSQPGISQVRRRSRATRRFSGRER